MSTFLNKAKEQLLIYYGIIFYIILFSAVSFGTAWQTAMAGADYSELGGDAKVRVWVGVFTSWGTVMLAFLNRSLDKVAKGKLPFDSGVDETTEARQVTHTEITTTAETKPKDQ